MGNAEQPDLDENGLLKNPAQWNEALAREIARRHGIEVLTDEHWKVIRRLREYHARFGVAPPTLQMCGLDDPYCGHDLFHNALNAWRIAGLPDPGEEAKAYLNNI